MKRKPEPIHQLSAKPRLGVSLIEVLVSVMIMSIGVALLSTLLPISILRTAQATQLTQSVFLRNNAEALIEANPSILNSVPVGSLGLIDPLGASISMPKTLYGNTGAGSISRFPLPNPNGTPSITADAAQQLASLPDSWTDLFETNVTAFDSTHPQVTVAKIPTTISPWNSNSLSNAKYRMILIDVTGKSAVIRSVLGVDTTNSTFSWTDGTITEPNLPSGFTPIKARVEVQTRRFTWLMTVSKSSVPKFAGDNLSWATEIDVAVFFNRSFKLDEEQPLTLSLVSNGFDGKPGVAGVDDDGNGTTDDAIESGWPGSDDNRTVDVTGTPFLKKGSYMLEASLLKWYRIVDFPENSKTNPRILLDRDLRTSVVSGVTSTGVFMKGIVEVYPLGVRTGQN
ncbi:MAG: prepilin-type N-terminal cleavage/methylation domain-containing protein [Schlesneria sp.]